MLKVLCLSLKPKKSEREEIRKALVFLEWYMSKYGFPLRGVRSQRKIRKSVEPCSVWKGAGFLARLCQVPRRRAYIHFSFPICQHDSAPLIRKVRFTEFDLWEQTKGSLYSPKQYMIPLSGPSVRIERNTFYPKGE